MKKSTKWLIGLMSAVGAAVIIGNWPPVDLAEFISGVVIIELMLNRGLDLLCEAGAVALQEV